MTRLTAEPTTSALYATITGHHGPLRLLWRDVRQHVDNDLTTRHGDRHAENTATEPYGEQAAPADDVNGEA